MNKFEFLFNGILVGVENKRVFKLNSEQRNVDPVTRKKSRPQNEINS